MFVSKKISVFLQKVGFAGSENSKVVRMLFYITPVTPDLAEEISPKIQAQLFHEDGKGKWSPSLVMPSASFDIGNIPLQLMTLHPVAERSLDHLGAQLHAVKLSHLSATKLFPKDPNFTLIFLAEAPLNDLAVQLAHKYFKSKLCVTFEEMQKPLFVAGESKCEECDETAIGQDSNGAFFCQKHRGNAKGKFELLVKKQTPAEKAALKKLDGKTAAAGKDDAPVLIFQGAKKEAEDMSHANKPKGGKRSHHKKK